MLDNVFTHEEVVQDKDLTIANLRTELDQLRGVCSRLRMENQELGRKNEELSAKLKAPSFDLLQGVVMAEINSIVEKFLSSEEFSNDIENAASDAVDRYLENTDLDVEEAVSKAIEDTLGRATIRFN